MALEIGKSDDNHQAWICVDSKNYFSYKTVQKKMSDYQAFYTVCLGSIGQS